jgi:hypothetical protein
LSWNGGWNENTWNPKKASLMFDALLFQMSCISTLVLFFSQLVFRPFSDNMKMIAKSIEDFILRKYRSDKRVQLQPFNSATIITYINNMAIAEHRDQDFKKDGSFDQINNSQIQDTATAVLCFGDPRHLVSPSIK